jgi:multidrug efflux pump subunit AcrA (membrane-fusion protein)
MAKQPASKRVWIRRGIPVVVVVLLVGGFVGNRAFASGTDTPSYRLGKVAMGSVEQTLALNGTAQKVAQATASFKASGTVKSVPVAIGDTVSAGQTVATLDPTTLQQAVTSAEATLAQAQASLDNDENGTSSDSTGSSGSGGGSGANATNAAYDTVTTSSPVTDAVEAAFVTVAARPSPPTTKAAAAADVKAAQAKVTSDEQTAATNVDTLMKDITDQATTCAAFLPDASPDTARSAAGASSSSTSKTGSTSKASSPPTEADCLAAVQQTITDQTKLASAQTALANLPGDEKALAEALANQAKVDAAGSSTGSGSGSGTHSGSGSGAGSSTGQSGGSSGSTGRSGSSGSSGSSDFTAQRVASDQVAVQSAEAALKTAQANLADATLTAPIAGTVAALSLTPGASSGSTSITIVGAGAVDVTVDVPLASLPKIKVGQAATVTAAGSPTPMAGAVHSISLLPASSTTTSVSYPVVVRVPEPTASLASGSTATATITLASASNVVTVPNSAITTLISGTGFVQVVKGGKVTRTLVRTGAVGMTMTQVTSGLTVGQQVVIANLSEALPTTTTNTRFGARTGTSGLTSGLTGAGGGFAGGAGGFAGGGGFRAGGG